MGNIPEAFPGSKKNSKSSLLDAESRGGPTAISGFDFQRRYAFILLLQNLPDPDWSSILVEGAEDVEVLFNRNGHIYRNAIQLKNYRVTQAKAREIVNHFEKLDKQSPGTWYKFTIACTELDDQLRIIHNGLERYREAGAFYTENDRILANTRGELIKYINAASLPVEFIIDRLSFEIDLQSYKQDEWVMARAANLIHQAYPEATHFAIESIYLQLAKQVSESTGKPIQRLDVEEIINRILSQLKTPENYIPIKLRAPLRKVFDPLLADRIKVFGGRQDKLDRIIAFSRDTKGGYLVITAPPGFGKTALLAKLVSQAPDAYAYHFFTRLYGDDGLSEVFFLKNIVQQMAEWHGLHLELPDGLADLRALYQQLLSEALPKTRILVFDGLDEVTQWKLDPYTSNPLPDGLHVIVTIRDMNQDWKNHYRIPLDQLTHLPLDGLYESDIADVFHSAGINFKALDKDQDLLIKLIAKVAAYPDNQSMGADPFYVRILVEDVQQGQLNMDQVKDWPPGLDAYMDQWMQDVLSIADEDGQNGEAIADLLGTLVVAMGPVNREDLQSINPSLQAHGLNRIFSKALSRVRRFVIGNDDYGYALGHPRLRDYMARHKDLNVEIYRDKLLDYCTNWQKHRSRYAIAYFASHLAAQGQVKELTELFTGEWIAAQWSVLGTYANLVSDLTRTSNSFLTLDPVDYPHFFAWPVARQTARELMLNIPVELLVAWVRLGEIRRVIDLVNALGNVKGRAAEPMIAVAAELLAVQRSDTPSTARLNYAGSAEALLAQAIDMLPLVRSASVQKDVFEGIGKLLIAGAGFSESTRLRLIEQAMVFCSGISDQILKAACLGILASASMRLPVSEHKSSELVDLAIQLMDGISSPPDRLIILAFLIPALQYYDPVQAITVVKRELGDSDRIFDHSSLGKNPLIRFLDRWQPWLEPDPHISIEIIKTISDLFINLEDQFFLGLGQSKLVSMLIKLGQVDDALLIIEKTRKSSIFQGTILIIEIARELRSIDYKRTLEWLDEARQFTSYQYHSNAINHAYFSADLAIAYAVCGSWDQAFDLISSVRPHERTDAIINGLQISVEDAGGDIYIQKTRILKLLTLIGDLSSEDQAKVHAVAGRQLIDVDLPAARREIAIASSICLAELPEGDTDQLRELLAVAYHTEGNHLKAIEAISPMKWITNIVKTLGFLIERSATSDLVLEGYIQKLFEVITAGHNHSLYPTAVIDATHICKTLIQKDTELGSKVNDLIWSKLDSLSWKDSFVCASVLASAAAYIDPVESFDRFLVIKKYLVWWKQNGIKIAASEFIIIFNQLASVASIIGDKVPQLLKEIDEARPDYTELNDQITIKASRCLVLSEINCSQAFDELRSLVNDLDKLKDVSAGAIHIMRMFADFTGKRVGLRYKQVEAARQIGNVATKMAEKCPEESKSILSDLLEAILLIDDPQDKAQALANLCESCGSGPQSFGQEITGLYGRIFEEARKLPQDLFPYVIRPIVDTLCQLDNLDAAQKIVERIGDSDLESEVARSIQFAREKAELGELSDFDQIFVGLRNKELAYAILHSVHVEHNWEEIIKLLAEDMSGDMLPVERTRLLSEFIPLMTSPFYETGGAQAVSIIVSGIESFDRNFRDASVLIMNKTSK